MEIIDIIALVFGSNVINTIVTWAISKRKNNSEVDSTIISSMQKSLDFYISLSKDNTDKLEEVIKEKNRTNMELIEAKEEISILKTQMLNMSMNICTELTCQIRQNNYLKRDNKSKKNI